MLNWSEETHEVFKGIIPDWTEKERESTKWNEGFGPPRAPPTGDRWETIQLQTKVALMDMDDSEGRAKNFGKSLPKSRTEP